MTSYFFELKACPVCHTEFMTSSVRSCNTLALRFIRTALWYDEGSALIVCLGCQRYFWKEDVPTRETIGESEYFMNPAKEALPGAVDVRGARFQDLRREASWTTASQEKVRAFSCMVGMQ